MRGSSIDKLLKNISDKYFKRHMIQNVKPCFNLLKGKTRKTSLMTYLTVLYIDPNATTAIVPQF